MATKPTKPGKPGDKKAVPSRQQSDQKRSDARATSLEAGRHLQRMLDQAPGAAISKSTTAGEEVQRTARRVIELAEKIEVHVVPGVVTQDNVLQRLEQLRQTLSLVEPKAVGSTLNAGDEVHLDLLGYMNGDVFLASSDTWYILTGNPLLPGLFEALVGARVPDHRIVYVRLPDDYPVGSQAGRTVVFAVTIREARHRTLPNVKDPLFLPFVGRPGVKTLDDLTKSIKGELLAERAQQMVAQAKLLFLRELYMRCMADDVPSALIDEELSRRWRELQGEALALQGVALEDQRKSQAAYAGDPTMREEARRSVWEMRMLEAVADAIGVEVSDETLKPILQGMFGPTVDVDQILYKNPGLHKDLLRGLRMKRATEALLTKATVLFDAVAGEKKVAPIVAPEDKPNANVTAARGLKRPPSSSAPPVKK